MAKIKFYFILTSTDSNFIFWLLNTLSIFIQKIMAMVKLTHYWKVKDQIDTIVRLGIKLKYGE